MFTRRGKYSVNTLNNDHVANFASFCKYNTFKISIPYSEKLRRSQVIINAGSQLSDFFRSPKKIVDLVVTNWMHVPIVRMVSKPKIRACPNVQIGVGELVGAQLETLSFSPKFRLLMGLNRSCV